MGLKPGEGELLSPTGEKQGYYTEDPPSSGRYAFDSLASIDAHLWKTKPFTMMLLQIRLFFSKK